MRLRLVFLLATIILTIKTVQGQTLQQVNASELQVLLSFGAAINPGPIAASSDGKIAVFDFNNFELFLFNADMYQVGKFGGRGEGAGKYITPSQSSYSNGVMVMVDQQQKMVNLYNIESGSYMATVEMDASVLTSGITYLTDNRFLVGTNGRFNALAAVSELPLPEQPALLLGKAKAPYEPNFTIRSAKASLAQGAVPNSLKNLSTVHAYENGLVVSADAFGELLVYGLNGQHRWTAYIPSAVQSQIRAVIQQKNRRSDRPYALFEPRYVQGLASNETHLFAFATANERGFPAHVTAYEWRTGVVAFQIEFVPAKDQLLSAFTYNPANHSIVLVDAGRSSLLEFKLRR